MKTSLLLVSFFLLGSCLLGQNAWINEIHYDNVSTDVDEVVEIVIENASGYTLSDFEVYLYTGHDGTYYDNEDLGTFTPGDTEGNFNFYYWYPGIIENGNPDGLVLVYQGTVISGQFLSYEGVFTATDGPANGLTSIDIGVSQGSSTPIGTSLQLSGNGAQYSDFNWEDPAISTIGSLNNNQTFCLNCPSNFIATAFSSVQIDLSWAQNGDVDDVMIAYNTSNTFGIPINGNAYSVSSPISGGGTVIFNGSATSTSHTGLTPSTQYFYRAWSLDGALDYSNGVPADATTNPAPSAAAPGDIIITEVMQNPNDVTDANGEWFELYNTTASAININGWVISDLGSESHTINKVGGLNILAGSFLVLGRITNTGINGGVPVDYAYGSAFNLGNADDEIILTSATAVEIDRLEWDGGPNWPDPTGASMTYTGLPGEDNNVGSKWITAYACEAGYATATADRGSPKTNGLFQNMITTTTWTGTGNWSEGNPPAGAASSWDNGSPGSAVEVNIDGTVTVDLPKTSPAKSAALILYPGKILTINNNSGLSVHGTLTDQGGTLTVETDALLEVK